MTTFNMNDGFCEALVRGFRSGFLTDDDYHHLSRCENIEGVKPQPCVRVAGALGELSRTLFRMPPVSQTSS